MRYSDEKLNSIYDKTNGSCHLCNKKLSFKNYNARGAKGSWHVDHSKAKANGGTDHLNNLFPACISCNLEKGTLHKTTIRKRKGYEAPSGNGCFITSACCINKGLKDNCYELQVLRRFRDTYVAFTEKGVMLINEYYAVAPLIVNAINKREDANEIYSGIYCNVKSAVSLIESEMYSSAFELYCNIVNDLKMEFYNSTLSTE
jgi:hypothetical protein